jgi:D-3-phosphoglycerate dehydrogenase
MGGELKVLLLENISGVAKTRFVEAGFEVESLPSALNEVHLRDKLKDVAVLGIRSKTNITPAALEPAPIF